ncbi:MAG: hypothetical protein ACLQJR_34995 [Stellaceae bacterium]
MMLFNLPSDPALLAALGKVAVRHGQLDYALRISVRSFVPISVKEALDATKRQGSAALRQRVRRLAKQRLGEGEALVRLDALLTRAAQATRRRNELLHGLWAAELDGGPVVRHDDERWHGHPSVAELEALVSELTAVTNELIMARMDGFLKEALDTRGGAGSSTSGAPS